MERQQAKLKIREFRKANASQLASGRKAFDSTLIVTSIVVILFSTIIWFVPNEFDTQFRIAGVVVLFSAGILAGILAQIVCDLWRKPAVTRTDRVTYFKYIAIKAVLGLLIITALYAAATWQVLNIA